MKRCGLIFGVVVCLAFVLALPDVGSAQQTQQKPPAKIRASLKASVMQTLELERMKSNIQKPPHYQ